MLFKLVSDVRKKWKTNVWNLDSAEKNYNFFFQKVLACPGGDIFLVSSKICANECSPSWLESDLKQKSQKYEKSKSNVWSLYLGKKNQKLNLLKKSIPAPQEVNFLSGYYRKCANGSSFNWIGKK